MMKIIENKVNKVLWKMISLNSLRILNSWKLIQNNNFKINPMKTIIKIKIGSRKINMDLKIQILHMYTKKRKAKMKIVQIKKKKML
jgi:hypothetical protein